MNRKKEEDRNTKQEKKLNVKLKTGLLAAGLVVVLLGSAFLYNQLKENYSSNRILTTETTTIQEKEEKTQTEETEFTEPETIPAPDFTVKDIDGNDVKLSDMFGKPIVINFWASWCGHCKTEMPEFEEVYQELGEDVNFMMINMTDGQRETLEKAQKHIEENGYTFPVYFDTAQEVMYTYEVWSLPTTYFIDKDGNVITGAKGAIDKKTLEYGISMILPEE